MQWIPTGPDHTCVLTCMINVTKLFSCCNYGTVDRHIRYIVDTVLITWTLQMATSVKYIFYRS